MRNAIRQNVSVWGIWPRVALLTLLGVAGLFSASVFQSPRALAAGTDPVIHWDSNMIYPGQNNGNPWGPVGENALVHGEKFTASGVLGQQITLALIKGDVNNPPGGGSYEFCKLAGPKFPLPGKAQVDSTGAFDYNFVWPPAANSGMYSICAYNTVDGLPVGNIDDGPFTALAPSAPSVSVSSASVAAGQSITVTGKNWVPPQDANVYIAACVDCDGPIVVSGTAHSSGLNTGAFSITFTIPANATPGNYVAGANAHNGILDVGPSGGKSVAINAAAAATPTVAPTATTQPTTTTATENGIGAGNGSNTGSADGVVSPFVIALAGVGVLLLISALIVLLIVALSRRRMKKTPPGRADGPPPGWGRPGPYVGDGGAPVTPGGGTVQQNWETLPPGWGDQTPPTVSRGTPAIPQGDGSPTRPTYSHIPDSAYPPAPPAMYPPPGGETPTQPGQYGGSPPSPYDPYDPYGG